ncbi:MAG: hypothetical protein ACI9HK_001652 [Pirellulaceae bacterium]
MFQSQDGKLVLISAGTYDVSLRRFVCVLNVETGELVLPVQVKSPCRVRLTKDGKYVIAFGDQWVDVLSVAEKKVVHRMQVKTGRVRDLQIQDGGTLVAVTTDNNCVETFDFVSGDRQQTIVVRGKNRTENVALLDENFEVLEVIGDREAIFD